MINVMRTIFCLENIDRQFVHIRILSHLGLLPILRVLSLLVLTCTPEIEHFCSCSQILCCSQPLKDFILPLLCLRSQIFLLYLLQVDLRLENLRLWNLEHQILRLLNPELLNLELEIQDAKLLRFFILLICCSYFHYFQQEVNYRVKVQVQAQAQAQVLAAVIAYARAKAKAWALVLWKVPFFVICQFIFVVLLVAPVIFSQVEFIFWKYKVPFKLIKIMIYQSYLI